jgi:hypothetical protein
MAVVDKGFVSIGLIINLYSYKFRHSRQFFLFPTLILLSGVGTTCFHHVVIKIRQLFLRPAASLTSTLHETEHTPTLTNYVDQIKYL